MPTPSFFRDSIGTGLPNEDEDVLMAKQLFGDIGRLGNSPNERTPFFDRSLENAIKGFQQDRSLQVDGWLTPGGETERNIRRDMGLLPKEPPLKLSELNIKSDIANGGTNEPGELRSVSKALGRLGIYNFDKTAEPPAFITRDLEDGIRAFQRQNDLKEDGQINPGGETITALKAQTAKTVGGGEAANGRPNSSSNDGAETELAEGLGTAPDVTERPSATGSHDQKTDDGSDEFKAIKWEKAGLPMGQGMRDVRVKGPIRVEASSPAIGLDQIRFTVDWHPLDKDGKVLPVVRRDEKLPPRAAAAGFKTEPIKPPFDWPHGFRATVSVPPQQAAHGNSPGPLLQISVPEGGLLKSQNNPK